MRVEIFVKQKEKEKLFFKKKFAKRLVLSLAFLACLFFIFTTKNVHAATTCNCSNRGGMFSYNSCGSSKETNSSDDCATYCKSSNCSFYKYGTVSVWNGVGGTSQNIKAATNTVSAGLLSDSSGKTDVGLTGALLLAFNWLLYAVFKLMGVILLIAANLFDWAVKASSFNAVMNMTAIPEGWRIVRDFLNLFFILVLLFSAFCTIFQVEKYNIKKILLTLVIMALLVNFSFPISRFIIDAGNIPMYYFFQSIAGGQGSISKNIFNSANSDSKGEPTGIMNSIFPADASISGNADQTLQLLAAIIFTFIFAMTLLVIAVLFVIRMLMLAILIIFSPVGFVASIFPSFSEYSSKWWNQLFKQSFFGTVMAFMLLLSLLIMKETQGGFAKDMANATGSGSTVFDKIIIGGVTLAIPIALLWIGMISAQSIGAAGAGAVIRQAKKVGKWAGKLPWRGTKGLAVATGVPGATKNAWGEFKKEGKLFGAKIPLIGSRAREAREERWAGYATGGKKGYQAAEEKEMKKRAEEYKKSKTKNEMLDMARRGDAAAAYQLALDGDIDKDAYNGAYKNLKSKNAKDALENKTREKRADAIIDYNIDIENNKRTSSGGAMLTSAEMQQIAEKELGKVAPSKWRDQDLDKLFGRDKKTGAYGFSNQDHARRNAAKAVYNKATGKNKDKITEDMKGNDYAAGHDVGVW